MSGEWVYWFGWLVALGVYAAMVYIAWRALFHDRSRGRRRCPRCWYDLAYSPGMTCAECGFVARREGQFHRTRRNYKLALAAVGACVAIVLAGNHYLTGSSWYTVLPTRVLIAALPLADADNSGIMREIGIRLRSGSLSERERELFVRRLVAGSWGARPVDDTWQRKYGVVLESLRPGFVRERGEDGAYTPFELMLLDLPASVEISSRAVWPLDAAPVVQLRLHDWWPHGTACRIRVAPQVEGAEPVLVHRSGMRQAWSDYPLPLPRLDESVREVAFDVTVDRRQVGAEEEDWITADERTITVPLRREGMLADLLEPLDDIALTDAVRATFRNGVMLWADGPAPLRVFFTPQETYNTFFNDVAIGAHVDILRDDVIVRRLDIWWLAGDRADDRGVAYEAIEYDTAAIPLANGDDGRWSMRITGDPALALRPGEAKSYWQGTITIPLRVTRSDDRAPQPRWWTIAGAEEPSSDADAGSP